MTTSTERTRKSLRISAVEGALSSFMVGTSESYMGGFAIALGHRDLHLALLATVPLLFGAVAQLFARFFVDRLGSRKRFVVTVAALQALVHIGLIFIALTGSRELLPLLVVNVAYWTCGMALMPAWNAWMGTLTSSIDRGRYFALRTAVAQVGLLLAFIAGGLAMEHGRASGSVLVAFAAIAAVAGVARSASAVALSKQYDPGEPASRLPGDPDPPMLARLVAAARASTWGVVFFVVAFQLGANVAIPFFAPYMLNALHFDFIQYMELMAAAIIVKPLVLPLWSRAGKRVGWRSVLVTATLGTACVALGWSQATSFHGLIAAQVLSGVSWAGLELSAFQLLLAASPERHRVAFFGLSTSLTACAQVVGSLLGSSLLSVVEDHYTVAFFASAILRALSVVWLIVPAAVLARRDTE